MTDLRTTEPVSDDVELGDIISDLWSAEGCTWHVDYDSNVGIPWPWSVVLEWTDEGAVAHLADAATYRWHHPGETILIALADAVAFCEALHELAPCRECDGLGAWQGVPCDPCNGTGLASSTSTTTWSCDTCHATGTIKLDTGAGVYEGIDALRSSHAATSPDCQDIATLRISAEEHRA